MPADSRTKFKNDLTASAINGVSSVRINTWGLASPPHVLILNQGVHAFQIDRARSETKSWCFLSTSYHSLALPAILRRQRQ